MTEAGPGVIASASLWERDAEVAAIAEAIDELCVDEASPGRVLFFTGDAGIGKTALLAEARRIAEERGCTAGEAGSVGTLFDTSSCVPPMVLSR